MHKEFCAIWRLHKCGRRRSLLSLPTSRDRISLVGYCLLNHLMEYWAPSVICRRGRSLAHTVRTNDQPRLTHSPQTSRYESIVPSRRELKMWEGWRRRLSQVSPFKMCPFPSSLFPVLSETCISLTHDALPVTAERRQIKIHYSHYGDWH